MAEWELPPDLHYTTEDEWFRIEGPRIVVGISDYAQQRLGDIAFVELPEIGTAVEANEPFGVIESVKAVADLYAPASGEVVEINAELGDHPETINEDCYGDGWIIAIAVEDPTELDRHLDVSAYRRHCEERGDS